MKTLTAFAASLVLLTACQSPAPEPLRPTPTPRPPRTTAATFQTRMDVTTPSGVPVNCNDGTVSGLGSVILRGYASSPTGITARFRFDYSPPDARGGWYPVYRQHVPPGNVEVLLTEISHDLSPGSGMHRLGWGRTPEGDRPTCTFRATNVPSQSEGVKTLRVPADDPLDAIRLTIRRYSDNVLIGTCTSGEPVQSPFDLTSGRVRYIVEARNGSAGYHVLHTHQETGPLLSPIGPDQDGDGVDRRWWEQAAHRIWVPGGNVWTIMTDTTAARVHQLVTFHATEGPGLPEVFCKAT